jgi:acyl carrier protein
MSEPSELRSAGLGPRERLIALVRHILGQPAGSRPLPIDGRLSDLGVSSIKMVSLMLAVEAEFGVTIPQREITPENFDSIGAVEAMILRLLRLERSL